MLYLDGADQSRIRSELNDIDSFLDLLECDNPFCACGDCQLIFLSEDGYYDETVNGIPLAINVYDKKISSGHYSLSKFQKKKANEYKDLLETNLTEADWLLLKIQHRKQKEKLIEDFDSRIDEYEFNFPEEHLLDESLEISYQQLFPLCEIFKIEKDNVDYKIIEFYSKNSDDSCTEINIQVFEEENCIESFSYDYVKGAAINSESKWVVEKLEEKYVGLRERLNIRALRIKNGYLKNWLKIKEKMMALERKNTQAKSKVGRNDACPCGSGKKYKKCCMKN